MAIFCEKIKVYKERKCKFLCNVYKEGVENDKTMQIVAQQTKVLLRPGTAYIKM